MKSKTTKILALAAAVFGLQLFAATPVVVFEGADLNGGTVGGYKVTLNNGNTYANGVITIGSSSGVSVAKADGTSAFPNKSLTVLIRYSHLPNVESGKYGVMADFCNAWDTTAAIDTVGVAVNSDKKVVGLWTAKSWNADTYKSTTALSATGGEFKTFAWTQNEDKNSSQKIIGPTVYEDGKNLSYDGINQGLGDTQKDVKTIMIGGYATNHAESETKDGSLVNLTGMKISGIAIYNGVMTAAEVSAYKWPSEVLKDAYLWLDASDASTISRDASGMVTKWASRNAGGKAAVSYSAGNVNAGPTIKPQGLGGKNVVDFGAAGSQKDLKFDKSTTIRTVFMVAAVANNNNNNTFFLADDSTFVFHRGDNGKYFNSSYAGIFTSGTVRRNGEIVSNPGNVSVPTSYGVYTFVSTGNATASRICQDRDVSGRQGGKQVAELIIFNKTLTEAERDWIENYLTSKWMTGAPEPDMSFGFDNGKAASTILGGTAQTGMQEWDSHGTPEYTLVRGSNNNYAMGIKYNKNVAPYNGVPSGMSDSQSWSVHASMKLAEVSNGVLFGISGAVWDSKQFIGVEYIGSNKIRVRAGTKSSKVTLIDNISVADATEKYHSYLLTFNASASGTAASPYYTLYVDGVKVGDSGAAAKRTGYVVDWAVGNYYGGADSVGGAVFAGAQIDDFAIWKSTCLSAEQAKGVAAQFPTWPNIFTATVTGTATWSALSWAPSKPQGGFESNAELTIKNTAANATITMDEDVTVAKVTVTSDTSKNVTFASGSGTITIGDFDISGANGKVTVGFATGNTPVKAGADTVLTSVNNPTLTIASGKKLTVKGGSLQETTTENNGTINFEGGTSSEPIAYEADGAKNFNLGTWTLAKNTYVLVTPNNNKIYKVTGEDASSCCAFTRSDAGFGFAEGSSFNNLTIVCAMPEGQKLWIERGIGENVRLNIASGEAHVSEKNYVPTFVALSGSGKLSRENGMDNAVTINCAEASDFSGTCDIPVTIGGTALQIISSGSKFTGALTVNSGATVGLKSASPASLSAQSGAHLIVGANTLAAAINITGGTSGLNLSGVTLDIDSFEESAISESAATYKLASNSLGFNTDGMIRGDSLTKGNWEVTVVDNNILQAQKKNNSFYIDVTTGEATHDTTSRAALDIDRAWIDEKCGTTSESTPEQVTAALNETAANGTKPWESYVLGLDPNTATSVPVIQPAQAASSNGEIAFRLSNVTVNAKAGADVTYKVVTLSAPGGSEIESSASASPDQTISVALPTSGVKYYKLQVDITNQ